MEQCADLNRIEIILVEPQDGANIGAVCRAMKTMGINRLTIIGDRIYNEMRIKTLAIHAFDLYEKHSRFDTLEQAIEDSILVVGASRRRGKKRKYFSLLPEQLAERISSTGEGKISIVFGRESNGLTDDELSLCHMGVKIPSSDEFGSLNLAQAVQVITYTLFRNLQDIRGFQPIENRRIKEVSDTVTRSFDMIGFYKGQEKEEVHQFFTDVIARAALSEREAAQMERLFRKMAKIKIYKETN
ncbi:MAG: RNA methyltransferase [Sphaerochaetaceae bacterium]|nr:RNA methyltransferase [Sphaerochaetaceae bacterium]MDC7248162.1 RNA methyltransferase [Sphaerochaetaceae bacterium]